MYPIFFSTPWFNVYAYGTMMAIGYTLGTLWIMREARQRGLDAEAVFDMLLLQMIVGVIGARVLFVIEFREFLKPDFSFWNLEGGGLSFYGAVISSFVFDWLYLKYRGLKFWSVMDCVGMGLPLGAVFARLGCFLNGCCHGAVCDLPWAMAFPGTHGARVHPSQLYESFACLIIFVGLQKWKKNQRWYGQMFLLYLSSYAVFRFCAEFLRNDNPPQLWILTMAHLTSLALVVLVAIAWYKLSSDIYQRVAPGQSPVQ